LPVGLRKWFVERLVKQLELEADAMKKASRGESANSQQLTAHNQPMPPPGMRKR